ncbi:MAG: hypothetical protein KGJ79_09890 [Alphaproteobacteria bacterium]|nr:hypothetical protein [Alphaproteobacteria bacterium]MDE2111441.1 hypothetical protein [Alphaproteobacteria bacterium]MDE2494192.1 hypothetical protein [Alphaproteobacteria bacterium]
MRKANSGGSPRLGAARVRFADSSAKGSARNDCKDIRLRPEVGPIVPFPDWLEHFVEVRKSDVSRISILFNAVLTGISNP